MVECPNCHSQCEDGSDFCTVCGTKLNGVEQQNVNVQDMVNLQQEYSQSYQTQQQDYVMSPKLQLPAQRNIVKYILFSILTLGIYGAVVESRISGEINIAASRADGIRTIPFLGMLQLSAITLGIYGLVWNHKFANRLGNELIRRGYNYKFSAVDFWLWNVLGSLILIGPIIYCYKKLKAMNMINASFNIYG